VAKSHEETLNLLQQTKSDTMAKYLQFIDDADDSVTYSAERLISMTCASHSTLLLNFESSGSGSTAAWAHGHDIVTLTLSEGSATVTITITDYTELNAGDKVNLVATDGNNYDFVQGDQSSVNGTFEATTSNNVTATNLMNVINTSSGPSGTRFTATVSGAVVTATQATGGVAGNTTVTLTDSGTAGMSSTNFTGGKSFEKKVMRSIVDIINGDEFLITVADDVKKAAIASIEIVDIGDNTTNIEHLHGTNGFTLISTDTTTKEYIFDKNNALGATGTAHADGVVIQVNGMSSASDVANQVELAIEHANGHNGKILVSRSSNVLDLIQSVAGRNGNTVIDAGSMPVDNYINFSGRIPFTGNTFGNFSNGTDGTYIDSDITACSIALDT